MGSLASMIEFLTNTSEELDDIKNKLDKIQEYFNNNFSNVNQIRIAEIEFLQNEFFENRESFPVEISKLYDDEYRKQEGIFNNNIEEMRKKKEKLRREFESINNKKLDLMKKIRTSNMRLDNREEKLKREVLSLEEAINLYNKKIDDLNTGLGFITNIFRMKKIQKEKDKLIEERDSLVEDIEDIRQKWQEKGVKYADEEGKIQEEWNNIQVELSLISEKLANLTEKKSELVAKATLNSVVENLKGDEHYLLNQIEVEIHDTCSRCHSKNSSNKFFCHFCGERFSRDRKDILGSLVEIGELNEVYRNLQEGLKQSVSFLALVRGIQKGIDEFKKSVESVKESQDQYPSLPDLKIDVPEFSMSFSKHIDELNSKIDIKFYNLHPIEFSKSLEQYTDRLFNESNIENFFNKMGDELNRTTKEQW
jgi:predicted  nucleic acid-binding Zn-ribbon protein